MGKDGEVYSEQLYRAGPALRIYMKATCMSTGRGNQAYGIFKFPVRHAFGLQLIELRFLRHPAIYYRRTADRPVGGGKALQTLDTLHSR